MSDSHLESAIARCDKALRHWYKTRRLLTEDDFDESPLIYDALEFVENVITSWKFRKQMLVEEKRKRFNPDRILAEIGSVKHDTP